MLSRATGLLALSLALLIPGQALASTLLIGDSITLGLVGAPYGPSFARLLEKRFTGDAGGSTVKNAGCSGTTSRDWHPESTDNILCVLESNLYAERIKPGLPWDLAVVLLGTNDAIGYFEPEAKPVSVPDYARGIDDLVSQLLSDGVGRVVLMTPPRNFFTRKPEIPVRLAGYRDEILKLCKSKRAMGVRCGPDLHALLEPAHFQARDIHPNGAGHQLIAEALYAYIPEPGGDLSLAIAVLQLVLLRRWISSRRQARAS